jgi:hypothetical protein
MKKELVEFDSFLEAQSELDQNPDKYNPEEFCPLISTDCNRRCVCYLPAKVVNMHAPAGAKQEFIIRDGFCDNKMFYGSE